MQEFKSNQPCMHHGKKPGRSERKGRKATLESLSRSHREIQRKQPRQEAALRRIFLILQGRLLRQAALYFPDIPDATVSNLGRLLPIIVVIPDATVCHR